MLASQTDSAVMLERMMERSELRIESAARDGAANVALAAGRVLESAFAWLDWSTSHRQLLGPIAGERRTGGQIQAVRRMALTQIHRKAPFEFLRDHQLRGAARHRFFRDIYGEGGRDYAQALVREHRAYIGAMCSYVCVDAFCGPATLRQLRRYESSYTHYWQVRAHVRLDPAGGTGDDGKADLVEYLHAEVRAARAQLLEARPSSADALTLEELRRPTGDTVRLRRPLRLPEWLKPG